VRTTISATADLDAPRERVWAALTDLARWADWNPHAVEAAGTLALGERLDLRLRTGRGGTMRFRPTVVGVVPGRSFAWLGSLGVRGLFDGRHAFALEDLPGGRTRIAQSEEFSGLLVRPLRRAVRDAEVAFAAVHEALAARLAGTAVAHEG
jgi:hypothetical protein